MIFFCPISNEISHKLHKNQQWLLDLKQIYARFISPHKIKINPERASGNTEMQNIEIELETSEETTWFSDDEKVTIEKINLEFVQSNKVKGAYRKITIFNDHHCYQTIKNKHQRKYKYRVDLSFLDPRAFRERKIAWNWLYGSIGLSVISLAMVYLGWFSGMFKPSIYYGTSLIVVISAMLISLLLFAHNSYDKVYFRSQYGRVKFIEVLNKSPDKATFRKFIALFMTQVKNQKNKRNFSQSKFLTRELQEIRRLMSEEVISQREYEYGKARILKNSAFNQ